MHADAYQCVHMQASMNAAEGHLDVDTPHAQCIRCECDTILPDGYRCEVMHVNEYIMHQDDLAGILQRTTTRSSEPMYY